MENAQIRIVSGALEIVALRINDAPTVHIVGAVPEDQRAFAVANLVQLGARAQQFASDQLGAVDIVTAIEGSTKGVHETLSSIGLKTGEQIERSLSIVFGDKATPGTLTQRIGAQLAALETDLSARLDPELATSITARLRTAVIADVRGLVADVKSAFDVENPKSPLGVLRADLIKRDEAVSRQIGELVQLSAVRTAVEVEKRRGTSKGTDFESALSELLTPICRGRHDVLTHTATANGAAGRKSGDFTIGINPAEAGSRSLSIAIEAKNDRSREIDLIRELDAAMENRGAAFGIAVTTNTALFGEGQIPLIFPDMNKAIVGVDFVDGAVVEGHFLEAALEAARFVTIALRDRGEAMLDSAALNDLVSKAMTAVKKTTELRRRISAIATAARDADACVVTMRDEVNTALAAIRDALADELSTRSGNVAA